MALYLVRHGEAVDKSVDRQRPLTESGARDVAWVGAFLERAGVQVPTIWHSGKTRARQTAECLARHVGRGVDVVEKSGLDPNDPVAPVHEELGPIEKDLVIVGHLPHLAKLASLLITGCEDGDPVRFQMSGVVCLERTEGGRWRVRWMVVPTLVRS